jgi:AcrR family transcriptional regulator
MTTSTGDRPQRDQAAKRTLAPDRRQHILTAAISVISEFGYDKSTIRQISEMAHVSRKAFYELFRNKQGVLIAILTETSLDLSSRVRTASSAKHDWPETLCAGLRELLEFFASNQDLARITFLDAQIAGPQVMSELQHEMRRYSNCLSPNRDDEATPSRISANIADQTLGAMYFTIYEVIASGKVERLPDLLPQLFEIALLAHTTPQQAQRTVGASHC